MAVSKDTSDHKASAQPRRRLVIGSNVVFTVLAAAVVTAFLQWVAGRGGYVDMTSSAVNSLDPATERLLENLEQPVRLTSLYFQTDLEETDQPRYRRAVDDLLSLFVSTNRSKIQAESINPLQDHDKHKMLVQRLSDIPRFKKQIEAYGAVIDTFKTQLEPMMATLINDELAITTGLSAGIGGEGGSGAVGEVSLLLERWQQQLSARSAKVDDYVKSPTPALSAALSELTRLYRDFSTALRSIADFGQKMVSRGTSGGPAEEDFLGGAQQRYEDVLAKVDEAKDTARELDPLLLDDVLSRLVPTGNALLVETDQDAIVVEFPDLWPPIGPDNARATFKDRAFKGEQKLTTAILRATHREQTAVVFVRYGGPPLFFGGFLPNQPPARFAQMKVLLEDTNFMVHEWDLKSSLTPPEFDPEPTRTLYVVFKPSSPPRDPLGRTPPEPPFTDEHSEALISAMGDEARALFMAGWAPGPFGPIPSTYEYNEYLKETWGIGVDTGAVLLQFTSAGGKKFVPRGRVELMRDVEWMDHDIVSAVRSLPVLLPLCAPLDLSQSAEGVTIDRLMSLPQRSGLWGVKNIKKYQEQSSNEFFRKVKGDLDGPFDLAVAAAKGDSKIVVISSTGFAEDTMALARVMEITAGGGLRLRSRNPGNLALFLNSLHWLNDNTDFMNIGRPIDLAVLNVPNPGTVATVKAFSLAVWPLVAMAGGCAVWFVRRR